MAGLTNKFTAEDIQTLIESVDDWESLGNQDFHFMSMIKNVPMPPEDHEGFDAMRQIKEHFKKREKEIVASRSLRQEKAVFLKAKLMLTKRDIGINCLFDMSINTDTSSVSKSNADNKNQIPNEPSDDLKKRLELAEFFIQDLGVKAHYETYLKEKLEKLEN